MSSPNVTISATVHSPSRERLRGIASMIAAVFVFAIMDSLMKRLSSHYGPLQVSTMRSLSSWFLITLAIASQRSWRKLRATQPLLHLARGALGIGMLASFVYAVHLMSMAQTYSLFLVAPLLMTALSVPMLGERVTVRRWIAIAAGLCGVLVILHPWSGAFVSAGAILAAAGATVCYSFSTLTVRSLDKQNSSVAIVFWNLGLVGLGSGVLSIGEWQAIQPGDWPLLGAVGIAGAIGQFWITDAFRRAPPSVVAPFEYTSILWAFAIDWIFWSATPSGSLVLGAAMVIATGIYVIWDERRSAALALIPATSPP
jgi:drug/metabolite transporter (DMT)-like permease